MQKLYLEQILKNTVPTLSHLTHTADYIGIANRSSKLALENIVHLFRLFKNSTLLRLSMLTELTTWDSTNNYNNGAYFHLVYILLSCEYNFRLFIDSPLLKGNSAYSLVDIYKNSNWSEREVAEMFGIHFMNNPDLRRLLTDYGFRGFPFRKDFPLSGYLEVRYDDEASQIVTEPLQLSQEYRVFSLTNPWEKEN